MASSDNMATIDSYSNSWFADYIARDAETLTKALQKSISGNDTVSPFLNLVNRDVSAPTTSTVSGVSGGSDQESAPKRKMMIGATGKVTKRKSRASKRSQTTFITADPANFRQMVQQVTGVRFVGSEMQMAPVVKPEPHRLPGGGGVRLAVGAAGCLPTLDTSAFLLDHHQQQVVGPNAALTGPGVSGPGPLGFGPAMEMVDGSFATADIDFDTFSSFPTLESWKVM
ncbi:hypothetical protein RIF29_05374 [Crotalaria pallida]|uniref:VQ domain-containing protein n=1 Tax=Crotalaria pallida TaxID=3830 RepID=A0AAN9J1Z9_CROPI